MMKGTWILMALFLAMACSPGAKRVAQESPAPSTARDPYLWLEDVTGDKALAWVRERNAESSQELAGTPEFQNLEAALLQVYDSKERIPLVHKEGPFYYNFWKDAQNPRGLWRRTTAEEYRKAEPRWDVILDLDALGKAENENWVWEGAQILRPACTRCLITLSRGGADASVTREFDMESRAFVKDGFQIPEAKGELSWIDESSVYVATDFGPGSMTDSGYPRIVKLWKRGTALANATPVYEAKSTDMAASATFDDTKGFERHFVTRTIAFFSREVFLREADGTLRKIPVPDDSNLSVHREWMLVELRTPWTVGPRTFPAGALLATRFDEFMAGKRDFTLLFEPTPTTSLESYKWTMRHLILNVLDDVKSRLSVLTPADGEWRHEAFPSSAEYATLKAWAVDERESDDFFMTVTDFLTPTSLFLGTFGQAPEKLKQTPAFFDASGLEISQHFVSSKDGTRVPYFQVSPKGMALDASHPTLLTGYGGFEISEVPYYSGAVGRAWLSRGGVYVVANIRGGGEYGPKWHQAALKEKRPRAYEDFAAVAQDLVARKVTTPRLLGTMGGSNGGLLMGNMITKYPELFGAVVCQVPLLDMKRYSKLLAGASWMAEYGDPDKPEEWAYIRTFSPYQNLKAGVKYPPVFFTTSTRDDRVHPGHARKMMAKMRDMGCDVRYYENIEGGHGGAADNKQAAHMWALSYTFLWRELKP
jgi:prolyl oligopeptidase